MKHARGGGRTGAAAMKVGAASLRAPSFVASLLAAVILSQLSQAHLSVARWKRQSCSRRNDFQCKNGECISQFFLCDGQNNCKDGSDETADECKTLPCPSFSFKCQYGACVDAGVRCNGTKECHDGSDEAECDRRKDISCRSYQFRCKSGICLDSLLQCDGSKDCDDGSDETEEACRSFKCPSYAFQCKYGACIDRKGKCNGIVQCADGSDESTDICGPTTTTQTPPSSQSVECGVIPEAAPLISHGLIARRGQFPWHAGIYSSSNDVMQQICGGSIISSRAIVSAAHCFWDNGNSRPHDVKNFKVAVGKHLRDWSEKSFFLQIREIKSIAIEKRYLGDERNYQSDIAVILLHSDIEMNSRVRPICLDFGNIYNDLFKPGKSGVVAGWGFNENDTYSEVLHSATLPLVSFEDCNKEVPPSFKPFLTFDKFCAGYRNGTSVCNGDSGGGYATPFRDGRWYLMGIVSVGVLSGSTCDRFHYATYTRVSDYYKFIKEFAGNR